MDSLINPITVLKNKRMLNYYRANRPSLQMPHQASWRTCWWCSPWCQAWWRSSSAPRPCTALSRSRQGLPPRSACSCVAICRAGALLVIKQDGRVKLIGKFASRPRSLRQIQWKQKKNKTISDGGITADFWFIKVHTSNWSSNIWGSSNTWDHRIVWT